MRLCHGSAQPTPDAWRHVTLCAPVSSTQAGTSLIFITLLEHADIRAGARGALIAAVIKDLASRPAAPPVACHVKRPFG